MGILGSNQKVFEKVRVALNALHRIIFKVTSHHACNCHNLMWVTELVFELKGKCKAKIKGVYCLLL